MGQVDGTIWFRRISRAEVVWVFAVGSCVADLRSHVGGSEVRVAKGGDDDGKLTEEMADLVQKSQDSQHLFSQWWGSHRPAPN